MIFVDTGAWVARFSRRDQYHDHASVIWAKLKSAQVRIVTSDSVFVETVALLTRQLGARPAVEAGRFLKNWQGLTILRALPEDEIAALDLLEKFSDQSVGFVDCLSFALIRRYHIPAAFSFDRHFDLARVKILA
ncbi:MAG TPA: PIN domain-containing protein [Chthoniobacter sp.]|jgi:hypothetical protein